MFDGRWTRGEGRGTGVDLDAAIDRAVGEMLDVEPAADLQARVMRRVQNGPVASAIDSVASVFRRKIWLTIPLAAAAAIFLAVWLTARPQPIPSRPESRQAERIQPPVTSSQSPAVRNEIPVAAGRRATTARAVSSAPRRPQSPIFVVGSGTPVGDVASMQGIAPIAVASVTTSSIAPTEIAVQPLAPIAEVEIAPLNPPDRRN